MKVESTTTSSSAPHRDGLLRSLAEKVAPAHTAVLVIDMQNDFCSQGGFLDELAIDLSQVREIVPRIAQLLASARRAHTTVVLVRSHFDPVFLLQPMLERLERKQTKPYCVSGTWGAEFVTGLAPQPGEVVITKHRYSAFFATELEMVLRARGVRTVILAGTATNNCVDGTGRDAFALGFYVVLLDDATAATSPEVHEATLKTVDHAYGVIAGLDDIVAIWEADDRPS